MDRDKVTVIYACKKCKSEYQSPEEAEACFASHCFLTLEDIAARHFLTGVEYSAGVDDEGQKILFTLDGITYLAQEDAEDDYRSCLGDLQKTDQKLRVNFPAVEVTAAMRPDANGQTNEVLELFDVHTGGLVLAIGTENTDDYYPYFTFEYHPENMTINHPLPKKEI